MARAVARHILIPDLDTANDLKTRIEGGEDFAKLAEQHSQCPSGKAGGSLGEFSQGDMVPEFDTVVFSELPVGSISEPVKTQFGYHLIKVEKRID